MDESAVASLLVTTIAAGVAGQTYAGRGGSVWTADIRRGWPEEPTLAASDAKRLALVRVYPRAGMSRDVTRYPTDWSTQAQPCGLTVAISGTTVTFAGACQVGQAAAALVGRTVYPYRVQAGDTPAAVASALAQQITGATASGATLTAPVLRDAQTGQDSTVTREVRRQEQCYMVTVWCADPIARDNVTGAVDAVMASLSDANGNIRPFITAADGTIVGPVKYAGTASFDKAADSNVYRRDLYYMVEYPTTQTATFPVLLFAGLTVHRGGIDGVQLADGSTATDQDGVPFTFYEDTAVARGIVNVAVDQGEAFTMEDGTLIALTADGA